MSRKQEIYQEILLWALPELRNYFTWSAWPQLKYRRQMRALSELIHNVPTSVLTPEFTAHDIWFMNSQVRTFCHANRNSPEPYRRLLRELFDILPDDQRAQLTWTGP